jgi:hypothetical protein
MSMTRTVILSVRLSARTRRILAEAAATHDAVGASALARDILEHWAAQRQASKIQSSIEGVVSYLRSHDGWDDEPSDFFPPAVEK